MVFSYNLGYTSTQWVLSKPLLSEQENTQGTELAPGWLSLPWLEAPVFPVTSPSQEY